MWFNLYSHLSVHKTKLTYTKDMFCNKGKGALGISHPHHTSESVKHVMDRHNCTLIQRWLTTDHFAWFNTAVQATVWVAPTDLMPRILAQGLVLVRAADG